LSIALTTESRHDLLIRLSYLAEWQQVPSASDGWKLKVNCEKECIIRVKCIRLADGQRLRFYVTAPKPATQSELTDMKRQLAAVQAQLAALEKENDRDIAKREKHLIRQPRRKAKRR